MAGTDLQELPVSNLMPDERREFHKIRPASHTLLSVNCLYQMNMEKRKGMFTKWVRSSEPETQGPRLTPPLLHPGFALGRLSTSLGMTELDRASGLGVG